MPLVDLAASDSLPVLYASQAQSCLQTNAGNRLDTDFFKDLQVYPAVAGAVVPIFNIPELTPYLGNSSLILGRLTVKDIFSGSIQVCYILNLHALLFPFSVSLSLIITVTGHAQQNWNDKRILDDNDPVQHPSASAKIYSILKNMNQTIKPVVRYDSSGTSEVFTSALALMDPPCATMGAPLTGLYVSDPLKTSVQTCQNWYDSARSSSACPILA